MDDVLYLNKKIHIQKTIADKFFHYTGECLEISEGNVTIRDERTNNIMCFSRTDIIIEVLQ